MENLPDVSKEIQKLFESKIRKGGAKTLWASMIGDPCERFLYHGIVDWKLGKTVDVHLQGIFELGTHLEKKAKEYLRELGYTVQEQLDTFDEHNIRGIADCFISGSATLLQKPEVEPIILKKVPVEIKWLMSVKEGLEIWDLLNSDKRWERRYPAQLLCYMFFRASEVGLFLAFEKASSWPHHIWVNFSDPGMIEYTEGLLKKADRVMEAVRTETPPERIHPSQGFCFDCDFLQVCQPPLWFGDGANELNDPKIATLLERDAELAPMDSERRRIQEELKTLLNKVEIAVCGPWIITGKEVTRQGYEVQGFTYWKWKAKRVSLEESGPKRGGDHKRGVNVLCLSIPGFKF